MAYFVGPDDSVQHHMALMRHPQHDGIPRSVSVIPPYAAFEDGPVSHTRGRPASGYARIGLNARGHYYQDPQCVPCGNFSGDFHVHKVPRQLKRSQSFTQTLDNPVVLRSDLQPAVPSKQQDIPLYNSLEDPHLEEYYRRKFKVHRQEHNGKSTVVGNGVTSVDACAVYKVVIATGDMPNAGTYANVFLRINGSRGKLNKIRLKKPLKDHERSHSSSRPFHFAPGSVHSFKVYSPDLGDLRSLILEHDGLEKKDSWFVEYVEIANVTRGHTWHFSCNDWLSAYKSDGKIARELFSERIEVTDYEVVVITGDRDNCETDANVFITLFGKRGHTDRLPLKNRKRWCFRRGQTDRFVVRARNVGKLKKIRIEHDNSGLQPRWFVERIVVSNRNDPKERYFFACGTWLSLHDEEGVISREFLASTHPLDGRKERRYKIVTFTGKQQDAGTDSDIFIQLIGELGSSEHMRLETPYLRLFERGAEDAFLMRLPAVGVIQKLRIRNCNNGIHPGWYLVKVLIEDLDDNRMYEFPCRRWIGGDRSRGHVWVELLPGHVDYDVNSAEIEWHFRVFTSNMRGAGTDAHVYMQLYGDKGKTKVLRMDGAGDKFEAGRIDDVRITAETVGKPYKMRIWHDNKGAAPGWHLDKIEAEDKNARKKYLFPCGRWLAADEEDFETVRELPASGDGIEHPLPVLRYIVSVFTGKKTGAGTDANVYVCIFGERGDTGDRHLKTSATNKNKFESGNTDQFTVEAVDLKRITKILVWHDNSGGAPGWFLDKITVKEQSGKYGGEQVFPCNRWLAKDEDDGQISRELTETGSRLQLVSYAVYVKTGDVFGAGTDANVFLTLVGTKAETARLPLKTSETHKTNKFERNQIDEFLFELDDIGTLKEIKIGQDGTGGGSDWYLDDVTINVPASGLEYICRAARWLKASDGDIILPVSSMKEKEKTVPYEITIWTGKQRGAGTDANVFVQLFGRDGKKTDEIKLDNKSNNFESGVEETFKINAGDIGPIEKLRVGHDNTGPSPGWFVDKIRVKRLRKRAPSAEQRRESLAGRRQSVVETADSSLDNVETYWFFINRWFAKDEDDKQIVRVFLPTDENGRPLSNVQLSEYELHVFTGDKMGAGTDANVFVNIFGDKGESGLMQLKESLTHKTNKFERNQEDVFTFSIPHVGDTLRKLHIRTDDSGSGADWLLGHVDIIDKKTGRTWFFNCNDWLGSGRDKTIFKDLPALPAELKNKALSRKMSIGSQVLEESVAQTTYNIDVVTGKLNGSGTDANVFIVLYGSEQTTDELWLKNSKTHKNKFENGQTDKFEFKLIDIGDLKKIRIGHDNSGPSPDWHLEQVVIEAPRLGRRWIFPCKQWFSKDQGDKKIERELYPQELATEEFVPHVPYEITVVTSSKRGAGTDADVFVNIYGPLGNTGNKSLCTSKEQRAKCFEDGSVDTFVLELPDVGDDIQKLRIGHDNSGMGPGWHLDRVEVRKFVPDPRTGQISATDKRMWLFPSNQWFDKREGDGLIVRELVPAKIMDEFLGRDGRIASKEHVLTEREKPRQKKYKVLVYTGDKSGAGSDANVFATFYSENSDTGEHKLASSQNMNKFERAQMDEFEINSVDIGLPIKCKIRQDNSSLLKSAWYLDKVELIDDGKVYTFHCERWLSTKHDDKKIERILWEKNYDGDKASMSSSKVSARLGSQVSVDSATSSRTRISRMQSIAIEEAPEGPVIPYIITIRTARERDAGTRANAWCRLFGPPPHHSSARRDHSRDHSPHDAPLNTGRIFLELPHKNGFLPGATDTFNVEAADVGEIREVELGHDGEAPGSGWLVTEMTLEVPTRGKRYVIPFNTWFAKDQGDGRTVRIVPVNEQQVSTFKPKIPYEITFVTGDVQDAGMSSNAVFTLFGEAKSTGEIVVEKTADRFERASKDTVKLELEDIGKPIRMRVSHSKRGDRVDWYLDHVVVVNMKTMEQTRFHCGQWISERKGDKKMAHDLVPVSGRGQEMLAKINYKVHVKTSSMSGAGTSANVFAIIFGQNGDSGEIALKKSESNGTPFQNGKEDVFSLNNIYSLGELTKVRIWHDNSGFGSSWHLDSVRVHDTSTNKWYDFPCNRWLSKSEDDKQIVRELACASAPPTHAAGLHGDRNVYEIAIKTSDREGSASLHNAWVVMHGERGVSKEYIFENTLRNQILRTGQVDNFKVESRPLGKLLRLTVGVVARSDQHYSERDRWHCSEVVVTDTVSGDKFVFPCEHTIPVHKRISIHEGTTLHLKNVETGMVKAVRSSQPVKYEIAVVTGEQGTDANVSVTVFGELGDTGKRELKQKWKNLFENGQTDTFTIEALDLGELTKIKVEHDNSSWRRNWFLERIEITNKTSGKKWTFPCKNWLSKEKGDFQITRELLPAPSGSPSPRAATTPTSARPPSPQHTSVLPPPHSPHSSRPSSPLSSRPDSPLSSSRMALSRQSALGALPASASSGLLTRESSLSRETSNLLRRPASPGGAGVANPFIGTSPSHQGLSRPPSSIGSRYGNSRDF